MIKTQKGVFRLVKSNLDFPYVERILLHMYFWEPLIYHTSDVRNAPEKDHPNYEYVRVQKAFQMAEEVIITNLLRVGTSWSQEMGIAGIFI